KLAEVVERLLALALLADDHIRPQPVERVFIVKIDAAPPGMPCPLRKIKLRSRIGCVLQVAPFTPRKVIEGCRSHCQRVPLLLGSTQSAARGEHRAQI